LLTTHKINAYIYLKIEIIIKKQRLKLGGKIKYLKSHKSYKIPLLKIVDSTQI